MEEIWENVTHAEGLYSMYQISNLGNLKGHSGKLIVGGINQHGYYQHIITNCGVRTCRTRHELVMSAFVGKRPNTKTHINHKNGVKTDNRLVNLEYCTNSENQIHAYQVLGREPHNKNKFGKDNPQTKLMVYQYTKEMKLVKTYYGTGEAARKTGYDRSSIVKVINGQQKTSHGFIFKAKKINDN